ncbi:MAG: hypothetical protein H7839_23130, partial [Magnetococcus sp. YQC-5]
MYEFFLGGRPNNIDEEIKFLVSVKRLLPRWVNSIPDSEFIAIAMIVRDVSENAARRGEKVCLVETGVGASSLILVYYAIKHQGMAFTWDFNSKKGSEIRTACAETIGMVFDDNINNFWRMIGYNSKSPYLGIGILSEWVDKVHFVMHDSEHVWENVRDELDLANQFLNDGSVVALDDAYYSFLHTDMAYINIVRKRFGLNPVVDISLRHNCLY